MHDWNITPKEAVRLQRELADMILIGGKPGRINTIAGIDVSMRLYGKTGYAGIIVFSYPGLDVIEESFAWGPVPFPYVPGLLTFREGPLIEKAMTKLKTRPDLLIFDGQGIAHPRHMGIAAHMGLKLNIPSIGCAKSRLFGEYTEPPPTRGSSTPLTDGEARQMGVVLRTRDNVKPVFVSPGHMVGVQESAHIVMSCTGKYRIPIPTREAHIRVGAFRKRVEGYGINFLDE
ncbi:MAG: endonuclease V [Spirochaetota bacterium]